MGLREGISRAAEALKSKFSSMAPVVGAQKLDPCARKWRKIHYALDAGQGRVATIVPSPSLDRFEAQPVWEMSLYLSFLTATGRTVV